MALTHKSSLLLISQTKDWLDFYFDWRWWLHLIIFFNVIISGPKPGIPGPRGCPASPKCLLGPSWEQRLRSHAGLSSDAFRFSDAIKSGHACLSSGYVDFLIRESGLPRLGRLHGDGAHGGRDPGKHAGVSALGHSRFGKINCLQVNFVLLVLEVERACFCIKLRVLAHKLPMSLLQARAFPLKNENL